MKAPKIRLTMASNTGVLTTAMESNGFHLLWDVLDSVSGLPASAAGVNLDLSVQLESGSTIPFDKSPYQAADRSVPPTACGGGVDIKVVANGLTSGKTLEVTLKPLY